MNTARCAMKPDTSSASTMRPRTAPSAGASNTRRRSEPQAARRRWPWRLIRIGDRQRLGRIKRDHFGAGRRADDFFLDARGGIAVARRAIGLEGKHHAGLDLLWIVEGIEPRDDRSFMYPRPRPWPKSRPKASI